MYQVMIRNGNEEEIINAVSTELGAPRVLGGSIKKGINSINNFSFTIFPNNIGYGKINALTTLVEVFNTKTNKMEFQGRILLPTDKMDNTGALSKAVTCESELGYLMDSTTIYGEYHNISVIDFLQVMIDNHNSQVSQDKHFTIGNVTVQDNNDSLYRFLGYVKTLDAIKDKLINRLGGELQIRYENGVRYLDYLTSIGEVKDTEIRLSSNLETIEREKDPTSVISRLIPLGTRLENSEERLTIESVNNGLKYIDDPVAIAEFGIVVDSITFDDVTLASNLLTKGQSYLSLNNKIKKKHKITAKDLSIIGLDFDSFEVGNTHTVINLLMGIDENLRIIEQTIDINNPQNSALTVGDKFEDIKDYQLNITRASRNVEVLREQLNSTNEIVSSVALDLGDTVQIVANTNDGLVNTNNNLQANIDTTVQIQESLTTTQQKLEKLRKRVMMGV